MILLVPRATVAITGVCVKTRHCHLMGFNHERKYKSLLLSDSSYHRGRR